MSSFVTNLNSSTAQEIVNWVTTADSCVHTADATQLQLRRVGVWGGAYWALFASIYTSILMSDSALRYTVHQISDVCSEITHSGSNLFVRSRLRVETNRFFTPRITAVWPMHLIGDVGGRVADSMLTDCISTLTPTQQSSEYLITFLSKCINDRQKTLLRLLIY